MSRAAFFVGEPGSLKPVIGPEGKPKFKRRLLFWKIPLFEYTADATNPSALCYDGAYYQPDRHFISDGGSIPPIVSAAPGLGIWDRPRAYPLHDSGYTLGGLYVSREASAGARVYRFEPMSRAALNALLCEAIPADGGSWWDRARVSAGLAIGSRWCWDERAQARARRAAGL